MRGTRLPTVGNGHERASFAGPWGRHSAHYDAVEAHVLGSEEAPLLPRPLLPEVDV